MGFGGGWRRRRRDGRNGAPPPFVLAVSLLWSRTVSKQAVKLAQELLDRFFRDAEGRTNRQLDVYFTLQDLDLSRDKAEPALEELVRRGLLNTFGPDIAFLTEAGVAAAANDQPIEAVGPVERPFGGGGGGGAASRSPSAPVPSAPADTIEAPPAESEPPAGVEPAAPAGPRIVHIGLEGHEYTVPLTWICTVGRAEDNDIVVNDKRASKRHAEIRYENQGYTLYDLDSANGTLLNDEYVVDPVVLTPDDEIVIGRTLLLYQAVLPVPEPSAPRPSMSPRPIPDSPSMDIEGTELPAAEVPEALLVEPAPPPPVEPEPEPEPELLDPSALEPLEEEAEALDPTPPSSEIPRFPADRPAPRGSSWVSPPEGAPSPDLDPPDEEAEATILTTREAIFGEDGPPPFGGSAADSSGDLETLPPGRTAPPSRARGVVGRVEPEPALLALLSMLRDKVESAQLPDRQAVLAAIDLLRQNPEVRELIRALEDEAG